MFQREGWGERRVSIFGFLGGGSKQIGRSPARSEESFPAVRGYQDVRYLGLCVRSGGDASRLFRIVLVRAPCPDATRRLRESSPRGHGLVHQVLQGMIPCAGRQLRQPRIWASAPFRRLLCQIESIVLGALYFGLARSSPIRGPVGIVLRASCFPRVELPEGIVLWFREELPKQRDCGHCPLGILFS